MSVPAVLYDPHTEDSGRRSSGYSRSIQSSHRVLGVPRVLKLDEREARRVARDPHVAQVSVLAEGVLDLVFGGTVAQISDVNLALQIPVAGGHGCGFLKILQKKQICQM